MSTDEEKKEKVETAANWLVSFISGFGVPANWAKVIAGAIIGAVIAFLSITQSGCTLTYSEEADGSKSLTTEVDGEGTAGVIEATGTVIKVSGDK